MLALNVRNFCKNSHQHYCAIQSHNCETIVFRYVEGIGGILGILNIQVRIYFNHALVTLPHAIRAFTIMNIEFILFLYLFWVRVLACFQHNKELRDTRKRKAPQASRQAATMKQRKTKNNNNNKNKNIWPKLTNVNKYK